MKQTMVRIQGALVITSQFTAVNARLRMIPLEETP
jgi:hypothetical protein